MILHKINNLVCIYIWTSENFLNQTSEKIIKKMFLLVIWLTHRLAKKKKKKKRFDHQACFILCSCIKKMLINLCITSRKFWQCFKYYELWFNWIHEKWYNLYDLFLLKSVSFNNLGNQSKNIMTFSCQLICLAKDKWIIRFWLTYFEVIIHMKKESKKKLISRRIKLHEKNSCTFHINLIIQPLR